VTTTSRSKTGALSTAFAYYIWTPDYAEKRLA